MFSKLVRQCVTLLLVTLLPLQAAAAGRMSVCAELEKPGHAAMVMKHCDHMKDMKPAMAADLSAPDSHKAASCWLGSICLAGMPAFAMPIQPVSTTAETGTSIYYSVAINYNSIVPEHPQRPPAVL